jgi:hypothetical protein
MVEVFRTDVQCEQHTTLILEEIHTTCLHCRATFDLQDCDRILRIQCDAGTVPTAMIINIVLKYGYFAEVLPDEILTL